MDDKKRRIVSALLVVSVLIAVLAQRYFAKKRDFVWDGIVLYAVGMLVFSRVIALAEAREVKAGRPDFPNLWQGIWKALGQSKVRGGALLIGIVMVLYVSDTAARRDGKRSFTDLLVLWGFGSALAAGAFVEWRGIPRALRRARGRLASYVPEVALAVFIVAVGFLARAINLESIPAVLSGDEASMGAEAISVMEGRLRNPFQTGWFANPTFYFFIQAMFLRSFGLTTAALRMSSALVSTVTVVALYLFTRHLYGRWVAILAAALLATYHYAIHYGRVAINNTWDPLFALTALYFLNRGLETKRLEHMVSASLALSLSVYFHAGSRLTVIIVALYLAFLALRQRDFLRENLTNLVVFGLITFVVALPLLRFFQGHPRDMMAPWTRKGIYPSGWLEAQTKSTGRTAFSILVDQFLKSVLAFSYSHDPSVFYRPGIPLLQFVPSLFFVFGLTYAVYRWRSREYFLLVSWFLLVVIFGGTLLENPPNSHRILLAVPPVVICVAIGLVKLSTYVQEALRGHRGLAVSVSVALALILSYQSLRFYFSDYTPSGKFVDGNTQTADKLGKYLRILGPEYQCYFFGAPRMYYGHPTIPFLAQGVTGVDIMNPIQDSVDFVVPGRDAVFVFLPERRAEFDVVHRFYPTGRLREFRDRRGHPLFTAYEVDI